MMPLVGNKNRKAGSLPPKKRGRNAENNNDELQDLLT